VRNDRAGPDAEVQRLTDALRRAEAQFQAVVGSISELITIVEADGRIRYVSPSIHPMLGYEPEELIGHPAFEYVHPDDAGRVAGMLQEAISRHQTVRLVSYRYRHRDGSWRQLESSGFNLLGDQAIGAIVVTSRDVSARFELESRYQALFETMEEGFAHWQVLYENGQPSDFVILEINPAFERQTGLRNVIGRRMTELVPDIRETNPELFERYGRVAATGKQETFELLMPGLRRWFSVTVYRAGPSQFLTVFANITVRRRTEEQLRQSESAYRELVERAPLGIYRSTQDDRFLAVNPALVAMLGYDHEDELLRLRVSRDVYLDPADRGRVKVRSTSFGESAIETEWKRKDGTVMSVRLHVRPVRRDGGDVEYFVVMAEDTTEQRLLERQFRQSQRMESVGLLAGGVAHDFNNLLTVITGFTDLIRDELSPEDPRRAELDEVRSAAERATGLTRQLLAFSRRQVLQPRVLDLNEVVAAVEKMLRRLIGEDVRLEVVLQKSPAVVNADPGQLEQVLLNLAVNARDAMPDGGYLTIATSSVELSDAFVRAHTGASPGPHIALTVTDTGIGMDAETRARVFEPFFTTKEAGRGTGLGLSTVYGIVKQSDGSIWVDSTPGRGTTFTVYLPLVHQPLDVPDDSPVAAAVVGRHHETVLVAEDDAAVRAVVARTLANQGYVLMLASDGPTALVMARGHPGRIDLLLTDLVMPGMSGRELATALEGERPDTAILFMSGYTDDAVIRQGILGAGMHYIQKPFQPRALAIKVEDLLRAKAGGTRTAEPPPGD
jgi:PAS domain S-box-containing protein